MTTLGCLRSMVYYSTPEQLAAARKFLGVNDAYKPIAKEPSTNSTTTRQDELQSSAPSSTREADSV